MMKMSPKLSIFFSFILLFHQANALNITHILSQYPNFSSFNDHLTKTNLAGEINSRQTITVLAVDNDNLSPIAGKSLDMIKSVLSVHVILDYFDVPKLEKLTNGSTTLTTLFQSSGAGKGQQGFLNVKHESSGTEFISAVPGSSSGAKLVKSVVSEPYNISVLQVSSIIIPQGIDGSSSSGANSTATSPSTAPSTNASTTTPSASSPSTSPSMAPSTSTSTSPSAAPTTSSDSPSESPTSAESPAEVVTPDASPESSPSPSAEAPAADAPAAAADAPSNAGGLQIDHLVVIFIMAVSTLCLASGI